MLNPLLLKILNNFFFIFFESGPDTFLKEVKPSFLYKPIFRLPNSLVRRSRSYKPTNSRNSAPSYLPMVTSNSGLSFFIHTFSLSKSKNLEGWCIVFITLSSMVDTD